ncbi:GyrI-like domain-containing protein [Calditrichota bacterium]
MKNNPSNSSLKAEYISRINRVIDYIEKNIKNELSLQTLADIAYFSPFYFHRIFSAIVGETLNQFIQRIRIEKAATLLIANPKMPITEVALECGFSGSSTFARAFKEMFKLSASEWRIKNRKNCKMIRNKNQLISKNGKDFDSISFYFDPDNQNLKWRIKMKNKEAINIEVKNIPDLHVAYIRHTGPYKGNSELFENLFTKLMKWAGPRNLLNFPETQVLAVYHDNPDITDESKLRLSTCISVPENTDVDGEIGKMTLAGGNYVFARFELAGSDEYEYAWNTVMGNWFPESGYQPDDKPFFELCHNDPKEHPKNIHIVDICVPVKPL